MDCAVQFAALRSLSDDDEDCTALSAVHATPRECCLESQQAILYKHVMVEVLWCEARRCRVILSHLIISADN